MTRSRRKYRSHRRWWMREIANTPYWFLISAGIGFVVLFAVLAVNLL